MTNKKHYKREEVWQRARHAEIRGGVRQEEDVLNHSQTIND